MKREIWKDFMRELKEAKFQDYKGHKYRIKDGYLYGKGWKFGISIDAIIRKFGSIEAYWDADDEISSRTGGLWDIRDVTWIILQ